MLTFLRKIRKSLIDSGSARKYVLYAIGEIVLVVFGILIALQINNWNQNRLDKILAKEYLLRIKTDIQKDTSLFQEEIRRNIENRLLIKSTLKKMYQGFEHIGQVIEVATLYDDALNQVFISNTNTYTDMLSTGNLRLIKNIELKDLIVNLYSQYEEKRKLMESDKNWMDGLAVILDSNVDFIKFSKVIVDLFSESELLPDSDWAFLNDPQSDEFKLLMRAISSVAWSLTVNSEYYYELNTACQEVLKIIDRELNHLTY